MFLLNAKFKVFLIIFLIAETVHGESLKMDTMLKDICSRSLSRMIFSICTGNLPVQDLPADSLSVVRGKRAAIYFKERLKRQVADECCQNACTVAQLIQYCPDTW